MLKGAEYLHSPEKRALDVAGATLFTAGAAPAVLTARTLLMGELGIPWSDTVFSQERVDSSERTLHVRKLVTLPPAGGPIVIHGTHDPRAGRVGGVVRRLGVDEMVQFGDVRNGNLSLVGPRPMLAQDLERYNDADPTLFGDWRQFYDVALKGIFGWSQLRRRSVITTTADDLRQSMRLDLCYAEQASLRTDLRIIATTVPKTLQLLWHTRRSKRL